MAYTQSSTDGYSYDEMVGRERMANDTKDEFFLIFTEDRYDTIDYVACLNIATSDYPIPEYVGDIKNYYKTEHPRAYSKFKDYMLDFEKLSQIEARSIAYKCKPSLYCCFSDITIFWDLSNIDWKSTAEWRWVNKDGQNYGQEKEYQKMAHLRKEDALWVKETE